jgi:hypothetical protein
MRRGHHRLTHDQLGRLDHLLRMTDIGPPSLALRFGISRSMIYKRMKWLGLIAPRATDYLTGEAPRTPCS